MHSQSSCSEKLSETSNQNKSDPCVEELESCWNTLADDYEILETLGSGTFGEVKKAVHKATQAKVAIKLMKNQFVNEYNSKQMLSEIQLMRKLT